MSLLGTLLPISEGSLVGPDSGQDMLPCAMRKIIQRLYFDYIFGNKITIRNKPSINDWSHERT